MANRKPITVLKKRRILHLGFDPDGIAGAGELVASLPRHYENHAPGVPDRVASQYQLYRPKFPELDKRATPGRLNKMAGAMRGYDLIVVHGQEALRAALAHTAFSDIMGLGPLVYYQDTLADLSGGKLRDFKNQFALTRTPAAVVPTETTGRALIGAWQVSPERVHPIVPIHPKRAKGGETIPRLVKRKGEAWIGVGAAEALPLAGPLIVAMSELPEHWRLVVLGGGEGADTLRRAAIDANIADRLLASDRHPHPGKVAGLFDMAVVRSIDARVPRAMPALFAAGVPVVSVGPEAMLPLMPEESHNWSAEEGEPQMVGRNIAALVTNDGARRKVTAANRKFAENHAGPGEHHALLASLMGISRLD